MPLASHPGRSAAPVTEVTALWEHHHAMHRRPQEIVAQWKSASDIDPALLEYQATRHWWDILEATNSTLVVTREYEHLVMALCVQNGRKRVSYLPLPHPNGLAVDRQRQVLHVASTRNPNIIFDFAPCTGAVKERSNQVLKQSRGVLLPTQARYLPGSTYIHDLALINGKLYANSVGSNSVIEIRRDGRFSPVWWPKCIDHPGGPRFDKNYLQLNSIAPGTTLKDSYFSASTAAPSARRPGHLNFPVDGCGVIFSGRTREPVCSGLTRPHSARLDGGSLWVDNSGYGEVGRVDNGRFEPVVKLPGWTRGLAFSGDIAFVASSRVIPRYRHYAPGIDCDQSVCGLHAIDVKTAKVLGSIRWPAGNQLFAIELLDRKMTCGFPFVMTNGNSGSKVRDLFSFGTT